jgi:hypothetical protein
MRGGDEGSFIGQEDLFKVQNRAPCRRGEGDLRESEAQAAAGMSSKLENRNPQLEIRPLRFEIWNLKSCALQRLIC